jgi:hypothetical protein
VSGLVLVTGAAGGGPGPAGRRMAGLLPDRGVRCVPSYRRETTVLSTFGSPGAEVAAGDLREIADVEPSARNNRAVGTATASSFLNSDAPLAGFARRGGQRPRNGLPVQTGCCPASPRYRSGLLAESARRARCAGMRALWPHNRAICTQTTEPPINTTQVNIRRYTRIAVNRPRIVSYNLLSSSSPHRQGSPGHRTGICVPAKASFAGSSLVPGSVIQWARLRGGLPCSRPTTGPAPRSFGSQFGSQAIELEQVFVP